MRRSNMNTTIMASERKPHEYGIQDIPKFLREYRYLMSHLLEVEKVLPWLRHAGVIDKADEEIILRTFATSVMRSGHMIDMLQQRGSGAINALLEIIEYDYPAAFEKITGQKPTPSPEDYRICNHKRRYSTKSMEICKDIQELFPKLLTGYFHSKDEKNKLKTVAKEIQDHLQNELDLKQCQIQELTQNILENREQNKTLKLQCVNYKGDKDDAIKECEELRKMKDEYQGLYNDMLKEHSTKLYDMVNSKLEMNSSNAQELDQLRKELEYYKSRCQETHGKDDWANKEVKRLRQKISELESDNQRLAQEKRGLDDEIVLLKCRQHENNTQAYQMQIDYMKQERDEAMKQKAECQKKYDDLLSQYNKIQEDMSNTTSRMRSLENETGYIQRPRLGQVSDRHRYRLPQKKLTSADASPTGPGPIYELINIPEQYSPIPTSSSEDESSCPSTPQSPFAPNQAEGAEMPELTRNQRVILRSTSKEGTDPKEASPGKARVTGGGKRKRPLVLFLPTDLKDVEKSLLDSKAFTLCPYEELNKDSEMFASMLESGNVVHYKTTADGVYHGIGVETLKRFMHKDSCGRVLLIVPVNALIRMKSQHTGIQPIVMVLKHEHLENSSRKSLEELELETAHPDFRSDYEKIIVSETDKTDLAAVAQKIIIKCAAIDSSQSRIGHTKA